VTSDSGSVVLNYSTPRVLLDRPYLHRSKNAVTGLVFLAAMGAIGAWMFFQIPATRAFPYLIARVLLGCVAPACWAAMVIFGVKAFRDDRDNARITLEGIEVKNRAYPWDSIGAVYATKMHRSVMIQFELRHFPDPSKQFASVFHMPRQLPTTPFLALEEFEKLLDDLTAEVLPQHPHVKLDRVPRSGD
jgi:hypothetical protein